MAEKIDITEIKDKLKKMLDEKRFVHTIAVCEAAVTLAERFGTNKEKAYLAALLHDCARGLDGEQQIAYCKEKNIELDDYMKNDINPVHALIGADMAKRQFGINDKEILDAISRHAVGCENMTLLDKIIFIADMIEPNRTGNDADKARKLAEKDLDKALVPAMRMKTYYLKGKPMHPNSVKMLKKYKRRGLFSFISK
jgi:predicted HD superfamily hydrolase involved in NAD metabolism